MSQRPLLCQLSGLLFLAGCTAMDSSRRDAEPVAPARNLVVDGVPTVPESVLAGLEGYRNTRSASLLGWIGDGVLIATRFGNTTQLHQVEAPLGMRRQITFFPEPVAGASVHPDPARNGFVYLKDSGGSEFYQMFWYDNASADSMLLSDGKSRYTGVSWSPSGAWLGYSTTERNGTDWDLHAKDLRGGRMILQEGEGVGWSIEDWSPDDRRVLTRQYISVNESRLYEMDVNAGKPRRLLPDVTAGFGGVRYGPGRSVYFTSDMNGEFTRLHRLDLESGAIDVLTAETPWDVESFAVSRDPAANRLRRERRRRQSAVRPQPRRRRLYRLAAAAPGVSFRVCASTRTAAASGLPYAQRPPPRTSSASTSAPAS